MKKLTKKQGIIIGIVGAIILVVAIVLGVIFGGRDQDIKHKNDTKIEAEADKKADEKESEDETQKEDSDDTNTEQEDEEKPEEQQTTQNTTVEEPKQETQNQTSTNTNQNNSNANSGSNTGSTTTTPNTPITPTPTPTPEPEKSPYAGMYTMLDDASKTRFVTCGNILRTGKAGQYIQVQETFIDYFNGNIVMTNSNTDGSWMCVYIAGWSTNKGSVETAPTYAELPSLAKQCLETIAPEGGTALYNTINSLILQYGGARYVPTQGRVSESIPGLYVTLTQGRSGLEVGFWAE